MKSSTKSNGSGVAPPKNGTPIQITPDNQVKDPLAILLERSYANRLDLSIQEFLNLNQNLSANSSLNYLRASTILHSLLDAILVAEKTHSKETLRSKLSEIRAIHRQSPLFIRTQDWPRGYAGDFETIEYIIEGKNKSAENTLGYYLESIVQNSPIIQQHRNKVNHQAKLILEKAYEKDNASILSIGCGSSADLHAIQHSLKRTNVEITLFDMDEGALACSEAKLDMIRDKCSFIQGNLLRLVKKIDKKFDLILIGGVFDYLTDKTIIALLHKLFLENMQAKGELFFTNIAKGNPYRTWMEYLLDWELIERSREDIQDLFVRAQLSSRQININKEETGLTYLAHIK